MPGKQTVNRHERTSYSVRLLDGFEMRSASGEIALSPTSERIVAFLALRSRPSPRHLVAESLFEDGTCARASGRLRSAMHRIQVSAPDLVTSDGRRLAIATGCSIDVQELDRAFARLLHPSGGRVDELPDLELFTGELLPGWYDDWVLAERERLRQRCLHALDAVGDQHLRRGRTAEAIEAGLAAVAVEPLRETPHRLLVRAHLAEGNTSEAIRVCEQFADLLDRELGVDPTDELLSLLDPSGRESPGTTRS